MGDGVQQAPTPYQPANQPGADSAFQAGAGQLGAAGTALYGSTAPQLAGVTQAVTNNPYYQQAMSGAQNAANLATGSVAPGQFAGAAQDAGIAGLAAGAAPGYAGMAAQGGVNGYNAASSLMPQATAGASLAPGVFGQAQGAIPAATAGAGMAPGVFGQAQSMIPSTTGGAAYAPAALAALAGAGAQTYGENQQALSNLGTTGLQAGNQVLNTGFDPQQQLYDRNYQQQMDQQNAINAMNGVAGSPYAAGVAGDASRNFNIDWQNAQLNRQISALGAYDSAASTYAGNTANLTTAGMNNLATGVNSGVNDYNSLTSNAANNLATLQTAGTNNFNSLNNSAADNLANLQTAGTNNFNSLNNSAIGNATNLINTGTGALNSGINTAAGAINSLGSTATGANAAASDLGTAGLNTLAGAAQLPNDIYMQQQQAQLQALLAQIGGTNQSLAGVQQAVGDQGQYLNIGQTASQGAANAAHMNNQDNQAASAGLGNLFGSVLGMFSFAGKL